VADDDHWRRLVIQVFGGPGAGAGTDALRSAGRTGPDFAAIFPPQAQPTRWPPRAVLGDETLSAFANRLAPLPTDLRKRRPEPDVLVQKRPGHGGLDLSALMFAPYSLGRPGRALRPRTRGRPCLLRPSGQRHPLSDRRTSHQSTRPSPPPPPRGSHRAAGRTHRDARSTQRLTSSRNTRPVRSVAVRGKPTVTLTALAARTPSAICPWTPQHSALQRYKVTHGGQRRNGPHSREFPASGPFSQVVAGVGFEPT
jgi:hypothetical protein